MSQQAIGRLIEILLVEDNPADVRLTIEALNENKVLNNLSVAEDGEQALAFLRQQGPFASAPRPDVILLDLNLPRKNGREVLAAIKSDPNLKQIPVVILSSSEDDRDVLEAYRLHANCYITKPVDMNQFLTVVRSINSFWFSIVTLPPRE